MATVELYGIPRERIGVSQVDVQGRTLGEILSELALRFPNFAKDCLTEQGELLPAYIAIMNGEQFCRDVHQPIGQHTHLIILSADVGG